MRKDDKWRINADEAPEGYFAITKDDAARETKSANLCRACHWQPQCNDSNTDFTKANHRCMSYGVITPDGKTIQRQDGCSVVFKKRATMYRGDLITKIMIAGKVWGIKTTRTELNALTDEHLLKLAKDHNMTFYPQEIKPSKKKPVEGANESGERK